MEAKTFAILETARVEEHCVSRKKIKSPCLVNIFLVV
jgi:hypothetical protein